MGYSNLPVGSTGGLGAVLLAAIVANSAPDVPAADRQDLFGLCELLRAGEPVYQPNVRHRLQRDRVGLTRSIQSLVKQQGRLEIHLCSNLASPTQLILASLYATQTLPELSRTTVFSAIDRAWSWNRDIDAHFIQEILSVSSLNTVVDVPEAWSDPVGWAMNVFSIVSAGDSLSKRAIQRRFRSLLREAHPDHGASAVDAGHRIRHLTEARDILLRQVA